MNKKSIKDDSTLIVVAVLLLILSGAVIFWSSAVKDQNRSDAAQVLMSEVIGKATLTIDFGSNRKRAFEGDIVENETFIDILNQASKAGNFSYKLDEKSRLIAVESFFKNDKKFWQNYVNSQKIDKPLSEVIIKGGDDILIKYD